MFLISFSWSCVSFLFFLFFFCLSPFSSSSVLLLIAISRCSILLGKLQLGSYFVPKNQSKRKGCASKPSANNPTKSFVSNMGPQCSFLGLFHLYTPVLVHHLARPLRTVVALEILPRACQEKPQTSKAYIVLPLLEKD